MSWKAPSSSVLSITDPTPLRVVAIQFIDISGRWYCGGLLQLNCVSKLLPPSSRELEISGVMAVQSSMLWHYSVMLCFLYDSMMTPNIDSYVHPYFQHCGDSGDNYDHWVYPFLSTCPFSAAMNFSLLRVSFPIFTVPVLVGYKCLNTLEPH